MLKRTTTEFDKQLLDRARQAPGNPTIRATVEEASHRAAEAAEVELEARKQRQLRYEETLGDHDVFRSDEMWR